MLMWRVLRVLVGLTLPGVLLSFIVAQMWVHRSSYPAEPSPVPYIIVGLLFGVAMVSGFGVRSALAAGLSAVLWSVIGLFPLRWFMSTDDLHALPTTIFWIVLVAPALIVATALTAGVRALLRR